MGRLQGKIAFVTGAASGLGRACAERFVREGASVIAADIKAGDVRAVAAALGAAAVAEVLDVTDEAAWRAAVDRAVTRFGRLDVMLNAAGIAHDGDHLDAMSQEAWRATMTVNLDGTFLGCREAVRAMKPGGGGSIVNIASVLANAGTGDYAAYGASKGGVRLLTKSIAVYCARMRNGIRCNSVHPGYIATPMVMPLVDEAPDPKAALAALEARHPIGRLGRAEEVAGVALYLASDESTYVTGAEIAVDGGYLAA